MRDHQGFDRIAEVLLGEIEGEDLSALGPIIRKPDVGSEPGAPVNLVRMIDSIRMAQRRGPRIV